MAEFGGSGEGVKSRCGTRNSDAQNSCYRVRAYVLVNQII